ncbi:MAG: Gldg family protein, partial [Bacteroidota bacterium]
MNNRSKSLQYVLVIGIILVVNLIASGYFFRIDLTKEKRFSLSDATEAALDSLDLPLFVSVYMEGDFPAEIRVFQEAVRTTLTEMGYYADGNLQFEFVNPTGQRELESTFQKFGFTPVPVKIQDQAETRLTYMWPLARFVYKEYEQYVDLLKGCSVLTPQGTSVNFLKAEADLEYKLMSAVLNLTRERRGVVGLLRGHGELPNREIREFGSELANSYNVFEFDMKASPGVAISPSVDVLVVLQPQTAFTEREKYELDQYLMRGGSIFFVMDQQDVNLDLFQKVSTLTELRELNLDDLFMRYGFKLNYDLVQDLNCETTELFQPEAQTFTSQKWIFSPMVLNFPSQAVNRNIDAVMLRYASSIDTFQ